MKDMNFFQRGISRTLLLILVIILAFGTGLFTEDIIQKYYQRVGASSGLDFSLLEEVFQKIEAGFVAPEKLDKTKLIYGAASGMVESLNDPYTVFFDPEETEKFEEDISGFFEGVGIQIGIKEEQLQVIAPLEGTPSQKAGVRAGDKILKVDGASIAGMPIEEVISLIRGPKNTTVTLTISRQDWEEPKDLKIIRDTIKVPTLKWELKETQDGKKVAYFTLFYFSDIIYKDFKEAAYEILNSGAEGIILDLRNNPGGVLSQVEEIAGWFLKEGDVILTEQIRGHEQKHKSKGPSKFVSYPLVVLINQGSASASEILVASLRDNRQVPIIGETSFGKGCVQRLIDLKDGSSIKMTTSKWFTPSGEGIEGKGLKPDIEVNLTPEDYQKGSDPQLEQAMEIITSKL